MTETLTSQQQMERGRCIARLYIAAQHLSEAASCAALDLLENASTWTLVGFDQEMAKSPYPVRARDSMWAPLKHKAQMNTVCGRQAHEARMKAMTTPPWLAEGF